MYSRAADFGKFSPFSLFCFSKKAKIICKQKFFRWTNRLGVCYDKNIIVLSFEITAMKKRKRVRKRIL